jgi:hypothetical protein
VTDATKVRGDFEWRLTPRFAQIVRDIRSWIGENRESLDGILA